VNNALRYVADPAAIHVFAENLRKVLLASPYGAKSVLGVDPAQSLRSHRIPFKLYERDTAGSSRA
jgi:transcriptional accessory protein Tex/SPT6